MNPQNNTTHMAFAEFVALMALMMSLVALSIDAMLPALPQIGADLNVLQANDNQLIVSLLFLGFALGQIIYGPVSDSFGRKPAVYLGFSLVITGCILSLFAETFTMMLVGRFLQGLGLAAPRVITFALVRDQFHGNEMARVMSFIMSIFILMPMIAPALGQGILLLSNWRMIFAFILGLSILVLLWFNIRQPETLTKEQRQPFSLSTIMTNLRAICRNRVVLGYTVMSGFVFSSFLGYLSSAQQIFQDLYQLGTMFPLYFALLALAAGCASLINARLVMIFGMFNMARFALITTSLISIFFFVVVYQTGGQPQLWLLMVYLFSVIFCFGLLMGNLNALAMEPLGHMAGIGASLVGALSTFISVPFGILIGQSYQNSVLPLVAGFTIFSLLSLMVMYWIGLKKATEL